MSEEIPQPNIPQKLYNPANPYPLVEQCNGLNADRKEAFLQAYAKVRSLHMAAEMIGLSRHVVSRHLNSDTDFRRCFDDVVDALTDDMEAKIYEYAQRPTNFMDRIAWLRAHRPGKWAEQSHVVVDRMEISEEQLQKRFSLAKTVIDADIVQTDKLIAPK